MKVFCGSNKRAARQPNINNPDVSSTTTTALNANDKQNPSAPQQKNDPLDASKAKTAASDVPNAPIMPDSPASLSLKSDKRQIPTIALKNVSRSDPSKWYPNKLPTSTPPTYNESARHQNDHDSIISRNTPTGRTLQIEDSKIQNQDHKYTLRSRPSKHLDCSPALNVQPYKRNANESHHNRYVSTPRRPEEDEAYRRRLLYREHSQKHPVLDDSKRRDCKICVERSHLPDIPSGNTITQYYCSPRTKSLRSPHPQPSRTPRESTAFFDSRHHYHSPPNAQNITLTLNVLDRKNSTASQLYRNNSVSSAHKLESPISSHPDSTPAVPGVRKTSSCCNHRRECMQGPCDCYYRYGASYCHLLNHWSGLLPDFENHTDASLDCDGTCETCDVSFSFHDAPSIPCCCFQHSVNAPAPCDCSQAYGYGYWKHPCTPLAPNAYSPTTICSCILSEP